VTVATSQNPEDAQARLAITARIYVRHTGRPDYNGRFA
jgi:hypothetical protein